MEKTYFEITTTLSIENDELWSWFCFEKGALWIEDIGETKIEKTIRIFFIERPKGGAQGLIDEFCKTIKSQQEVKIVKEGIHPFENWQANWKKYFSRVEIGKSIIILPSWDKGFTLKGRYPIWIEPGQGFGTGNHPSTRLALELLGNHLKKASIKPQCMIDLGTGSGILAIAACRLGVKYVDGVDIENTAVK